MSDLLNSFSALMRGIITEHVLFIFVAFSMIPGFLFMIALYVSILRIRFAIKRDGKEPPGLGPISLIEFTNAFIATQSRYKNKTQHQTVHGVDLISIDYALIQPYIKPIDRFVARAWLFFCVLFGVCTILFFWLYPELSN